MDPGRDHEFAEFVDGRFTALQRFAYLLTGEWHLAEDLVQTALTKVWFHRNSLRSGVALESYTLTVMVNTSTKAGTYKFSYTIRYCGNNGWMPVTKTVNVTVR